MNGGHRRCIVCLLRNRICARALLRPPQTLPSASAADASFCASANLVSVMMGAITLASIILFTVGGVIGMILMIIVSLLILVLKNVESRQTGTLVEPL